MDIDAIRKRLNQLQTSNNRTSNLWRPQPGKQQIRLCLISTIKQILSLNCFFIMVSETVLTLSPISFGRPDPIEEFANKLKASGNKEDYQLSKKLSAKMRTFGSGNCSW